jgi:hypothetical protein
MSSSSLILRDGTLWLFNSSPWYRWPTEIDGLPIKHGGSFHGKLAMSFPHMVEMPTVKMFRWTQMAQAQLDAPLSDHQAVKAGLV